MGVAGESSLLPERANRWLLFLDEFGQLCSEKETVLHIGDIPYMKKKKNT